MMSNDDSWHLAYIGAGANLGDRLAACRAGIEAIAADGAGRIVAVSRFYHTAPQDYAAQEWFVNAAAAIQTRLSPRALLVRLKAIEARMGRGRHGPRFGPRTIDLDILLYEERVVCDGALIIPHPRLHKRRFVLQPLCDIAAEVSHPLLKLSMAALLARPEIADQAVELIETGYSKLET
jgi:2-amino-4-hydroxy-6-hydroxymethyldihydropteridine diphosphokinase